MPRADNLEHAVNKRNAENINLFNLIIDALDITGYKSTDIARTIKDIRLIKNDFEWKLIALYNSESHKINDNNELETMVAVMDTVSSKTTYAVMNDIEW